MNHEYHAQRRLEELGNMPAGSWELAETMDAFMLEYSHGKETQILITLEANGSCSTYIMQSASETENKHLGHSGGETPSDSVMRAMADAVESMDDNG